MEMTARLTGLYDLATNKGQTIYNKATLTIRAI